jgi:hypothetical protein
MTVYGGLRLTTLEVKNAQPKQKKYSIIDGGGLQLTVKIDGKKIWEIRYTIDGKPNTTTIGSFPTVSLKDARLKRDEFKLTLSKGSNPVHEKKRIKEEKINTIKEIESKSLNTFEKISRDFMESISNEHTPRYLTLKLSRLENHIFPYFGSIPIRDVTRMMIVECMELLKLAGKIETARRVFMLIDSLIKKDVEVRILKQNLFIKKHEPMSKMLITILSMFSEFERDIISQRTKESLQGLKDKGIQLGKPKGSIQKSQYDPDKDRIVELLGLGLSYQKVINHLGRGSVGTLHTYIKKRGLSA